MKVRCIYEDGFSWITKGNEYEVVQIFEEEYFIINDVKERCTYGKDLFEIVGETFKQVIATIKEGEVWESDEKEIVFKFDGDIEIRRVKASDDYKFMGFLKETKYTLKRKEVTFTEAFKAYEEGKEIESCVDDCIFKKINGEDNYKFNKQNSFSTKCDEEDYWIGFEHLRGNWFINEN